jgi:diguanylate cyclase (GGDEF)-like protein
MIMMTLVLLAEDAMEGARILLVEDNRTEAQITKEFLEKSGHSVTWVKDGTSAIRQAKTEEIDCIILDLLLPDINGTEVCRWLKGNESTRGIPIIMLTVKASVEDKATGLHIGADDYLPKPYNEIELKARLYACLRTKTLQDELRSKNLELERMLMRVEVMAQTDPLTELFNRRRCASIIEDEFARTKRYESPLSSIMIDIDFFKKVNDEFGHRTGDHVLERLAQIIKDNIREVDTAARWGGEEFVVIMPETGKEGALYPARRILEGTASTEFPGLPAGRITISLGIATAPNPQIDSGERLIDASDQAMYKAKNNGRNRIELF